MMVKVIPEHGLKTGGSGRSAGNIAAIMCVAVVPEGYKLVKAEKAKALICLSLQIGPKAGSEHFCGRIISLKKINAKPAAQPECQILKEFRHRHIS
jgi:hypothetical protein